MVEAPTEGEGPLPLFPTPPSIDDRPLVQELFKNLKAHLPDLEKLLEEVDGMWGLEDGVYRLYHGSFKVYYLQDVIRNIVNALQGLLPGRPLNAWFQQIVNEGTAKQFQPEDNRNWLAATRPIVEACFHARYFLESAVRYGKRLDAPPNSLPSGWAAVLYLYDLR